MNHISRRKILLLGLLGSSSLVSGCLYDHLDGSQVAQTPAAAPGPTPAPASGQPPSTAPAPAPAPTPAPTPAPPPGAWSVSPTPYFLTGTGGTFDLATTLPAGVRKGGTFGVSTAGAPLPAGMTLSSSGYLSVGAAKAGRVDGVVFTYAEPTA